MKLAKKMLASVLALALVAALALTAFAAASEIVMTANKAVVGETVTVTVSAKNMAGLESADLVFNYDEAALEFVSIAEFDGAGTPDLTEGDKFDTGSISWSLLYKKAATDDAGLAVLTFKVKKAGATTVALKIDEWEGTDMPAEASAVIAQKVVPTTAAPTTAAPTTEAPTTEAPTTEEVSEAPTTAPEIPQTGEAGVAAIAGVMALAAVAFVATRKKDEE